MNTVDLHTHSTYSDGTFTPKELIAYAKEKGLSAIALTDHDTVTGVSEAISYSAEYGIEVIPGIEVSTEYEDTEIHIVGLFVDVNNKELLSALDNFRLGRQNRNKEMVDKLNAIGVNINYNDVLANAGGGVITRAHIAQEIIKKGYALSNNEVFDKYIGKNKPAYVKRKVMTWQDTISLIIKSGGIAVLAHPLLYKLSDKRLEMIVSQLSANGLGAIEAYYSTHSPRDVKYIKELALKNRLKLSGGSDFHGTNKPKLDLATGYGNLQVPYDIIEELKKGVKNA